MGDIPIAADGIVPNAAKGREAAVAEAEGAAGLGVGPVGGDFAVCVESVKVVVAKCEGDDRFTLETLDAVGPWEFRFGKVGNAGGGIESAQEILIGC